MKTLYLECNMGAAGDMLMAALLEIHPDPEDFIKRLNALNIPKIVVKAEKAIKSGIVGTQIHVVIDGEEESENMHRHFHSHRRHEEEHKNNIEHNHHHEHHHTGLSDIEHIVSHLNLSEKVIKDVIAIYRMIAEAESKVHGCDIEQIHFHEVGNMDAVADIVGVCMLIEELAPDKIISSPVHVGHGSVKCAHGILPVPAPAAEHILRGVPIYGGEIKGELCTPTGAALLKYFVSEFGQMPVMRVEKTGYGMGKKDFDTANCLRAVFGETEIKKGSIIELCCNVDDMTGEEIGFMVNKLLREGALDVYTTPIYMKKNRPAVMISCMCEEKYKEKMLNYIFKYSSTLGIREHIPNRYTLEREEIVLETELGKIKAKKSYGMGVEKIKAEFEDVVKAALDNDISVTEAEKIVYKYLH